MYGRVEPGAGVEFRKMLIRPGSPDGSCGSYLDKCDDKS